MTFRNAFFLAGGCMLLAGCSSFYMKASPFYDGPDSAYTEPIEQRVNLWPLLYSRDPALSVIWPLYTQNTDCWYAWPLLTWMDDDFVSLPLLTWKDHDGFVSLPLFTWTNENGWTCLPILSSYKVDSQSAKSGSPVRTETYSYLLDLGEVKFADDRYASSRLLPFYADNERSFESPLYCHEEDGSWSIPVLGTIVKTNAFYSVLFGISDTCWWITPFWIHTESTEYGLMGLCGMGQNGWWVTPAAINTGKGFYGGLGLQGWSFDGGPNWCFPLYMSNPKKDWYASLLAGHVKGYDWWLTPLVSTYRSEASRGFWAWPLCGWSTEPGKERIWWLSGLPLWTREDTAASISESILWRLWHKETKGGNVTIDCFPGITYDARADGYEKSSFLWRGYRNEVIPGKGRNLDVFFIPLSSAD